MRYRMPKTLCAGIAYTNPEAAAAVCVLVRKIKRGHVDAAAESGIAGVADGLGGLSIHPGMSNGVMLTEVQSPESKA